MSAEFSGLDWLAEILLESLNEILVERNGDFGSSGAAVRGTIAFSCAGEESELTDEKNVALNFLDGTIHDAGFIVEDAQANDFSAEPFDVFRCVRLLNSEKDEQAFLNSAFDRAPDGDLSLGDPLNHCAHIRSIE